MSSTNLTIPTRTSSKLFGDHPYAPTQPRHASSTRAASHGLPRKSSTSSSISTDSSARGPKYPKRRLIKQTAIANPLEKRVEDLTKEVAELRALRAFADSKIRALMIFGAHQDDAINLLTNTVSSLRTKLRDGADIDLDGFATDVNNIVDQATRAVTDLAADFPTTEALVSKHEDENEFSTSPELAE